MQINFKYIEIVEKKKDFVQYWRAVWCLELIQSNEICETLLNELNVHNNFHDENKLILYTLKPENNSNDVKMH